MLQGSPFEMFAQSKARERERDLQVQNLHAARRACKCETLCATTYAPT